MYEEKYKEKYEEKYEYKTSSEKEVYIVAGIIFEKLLSYNLKDLQDKKLKCEDLIECYRTILFDACEGTVYLDYDKSESYPEFQRDLEILQKKVEVADIDKEKLKKELDEIEYNSQKHGYNFQKHSIPQTMFSEDLLEKIYNSKYLPADLTFLFYGTGDGYSISTRSQHSFNILYDYLICYGNYAVIFDGPGVDPVKKEKNLMASLLGTNFTKTIKIALEHFIEQVENNSRDILLVGHSRGACIAMAVYNCICSIVSDTWDAHLEEITDFNIEDLHEVIEKGKNSIKNIRLLLIDPVSGGGSLQSLTPHKGFKLIDHLDSKGIETDICILKVSYDKQPINTFDIHIPSMSSDINAMIIKCLGPKHGDIVRLCSDKHLSFIKLIYSFSGMLSSHMPEIIPEKKQKHTWKDDTYYSSKQRKDLSAIRSTDFFNDYNYNPSYKPDTEKATRIYSNPEITKKQIEYEEIYPEYFARDKV